VAVDRLLRLRLDPEPEPAGELAGAEHAHRVFPETLVRIADDMDELAVEVLDAADVVDDREVADVVEQRVDREVAAEGVLLRRAIGIVAGDQELAGLAALLVGIGIATERRDLDDLAVVKIHVDQPEAPPDDSRVAEQPADLVRFRIRADVVVLRLSTEHQVPDAPPNQARHVAGVVQPVKDLDGVGGYVSSGNWMLGSGDDPRFHPGICAHRVIIPTRGIHG
jgi:hypothetical protein